MAQAKSKDKRFWGTTENAVRIQISVAIITYCLVAIVQHLRVCPVVIIALKGDHNYEKSLCER